VKRSLLFYAFLAIVAVSLASVGLAGLITRTEASSAFDSYLQTLPLGMGAGMGAGRHVMMGGAEQTFLGSVDKGILIGALVALFSFLLTYRIRQRGRRKHKGLRILKG